MKSNKPSLTQAAVALALACGAAGAAQATAKIVINNVNAPGVGFNDPTPANPVGGNTGTTLGQQRLIAFTYAANIWGATLSSSVPIVINAQFTPLACTATGAVLGSAGATQVFADFPGAPKAGTIYSYALANKLYGSEISDQPGPQINARFNSELGKAGCLTGTSFYFGLDANEGNNVDFVATLLHEMGHGLGFQTFTNGQTGAQFAGYPSVWDHNLLDNTTNKLWVNMTDAERAASALKPAGLSWTGPRVTAAVPAVLSAVPQLRIVGVGANSPAGDLYAVGTADFGPKLDKSPLTGQVVQVALQADSPGSACTPFNAANAAAVRRNIALVSRGACGFAVKVKNAQDAGAIGVIVADNAPGPVAGMGGADPSITIPALRVTQADGAMIAASLTKPNGNLNGTVGKFELSKTLLAGADAQRRVTMYTPGVYEPGSSVSHYNTAASRNLLMEPAINADLTHSVTAPIDLTLELLKDIGW
ncbi:peptidase [Massilia sp. WF1]|uniref:PA domain-containing protein n=1 Tax=unclassified Massilia TaxID=2609279 RepID=UPI00064B5E41|nr:MULTISPECIES: PA domain-containing protein [unclassified Massilia]ALK98504.1 peptidase [Massilia sp. WG5]KLU37582.1 peptidase [Massilia sp. WF1]